MNIADLGKGNEPQQRQQRQHQQQHHQQFSRPPQQQFMQARGGMAFGGSGGSGGMGQFQAQPMMHSLPRGLPGLPPPRGHAYGMPPSHQPLGLRRLRTRSASAWSIIRATSRRSRCSRCSRRWATLLPSSTVRSRGEGSRGSRINKCRRSHCRNLSTSRALRTNGRLPPGWRAATLSVTQQAASGLPSSSFSHSSSSCSSSSCHPMLSRMLLLLSRFVRDLQCSREQELRRGGQGFYQGVCDDFFLFVFSRRTQALFDFNEELETCAHWDVLNMNFPFSFLFLFYSVRSTALRAVLSGTSPRSLFSFRFHLNK